MHGFATGHLVTPELSAFGAVSNQQALVLPVPSIMHVTRVNDPSLPEGAALWICCAGDAQVGPTARMNFWNKEQNK